MVNKTKNSPKVFLDKGRGKDKHFESQLEIIFRYLQKYTATASMVAVATGIPQKNICRLKRDLEKNGELWQVEKKFCKETGFRAWYLTTDPTTINVNQCQKKNKR